MRKAYPGRRKQANQEDDTLHWGDMPRSQATKIPCVHRGDFISVNRGRIYKCNLHGVCTSTTSPSVSLSCLECGDYQGRWDRPQRPTPPRIPTDQRFQIILKSFRRFEYLKTCIQSIRRFYRDIDIIVSDDSFQPGDQVPPEVEAIKAMRRVHWLPLPFDTGIAGGRNHCIEAATAEYLVVFDDDTVLTDETPLEKFIDILDNDRSVDVVCGAHRYDGETVSNWSGLFRCTVGDDGQQILKVVPNSASWKQTPSGTKYQPTHLGWNCKAARRDTMLRLPYDDAYKIASEHLDIFLTFREEGVGVCWTPDVIFGHMRHKDEEYRKFRSRRDSFDYFFDKWNMQGFPGHNSSDIPGLSKRNVLAAVADDAKRDAPNIVLLTVGHTGSSLLARMLYQLGWYLPGDAVDDPWSESPTLREINKRAMNGDMAPDELKRLLRSTPSPWVIKDPRLCHTMGQWQDILAEYRPALVWLTRDHKDVRESYRRRSESVALADRRLSLASEIYRKWKCGPRLMIDYKDLKHASLLVKSAPARGAEGVA